MENPAVWATEPMANLTIVRYSGFPGIVNFNLSIFTLLIVTNAHVYHEFMTYLSRIYHEKNVHKQNLAYAH
jgi:hypothetical protein